MSPNDADGMANSVDPDQTAPLGSLIWVCTVCPGISGRKLRIITVVSQATRVTSVSKTLIDHIYSNCPENVASIDVQNIGLSDHFPIFFMRKIHAQLPKGKLYTISYRSFKNF